MKSILIIVCAAACLFLGPSLGLSEGNQNFLFPISSWTDSVRLSGLRVEPSIKLAYQSMNININFPIPGVPTNTFLFDTMDVVVNKTSFWVGTLDCQIHGAGRLGGFVEIGTSLGVNRAGTVTTTFGGAAANGNFGSNGWGWNAARPRWWDLNAGVSFRVREPLALVAGFKCDNLSEKLEVPAGASYALFVAPVFQEDYLGDLQAITRSVYIGLKIVDSRLKFTVLWSPWLTSYTVKMPLRVILSDSGGGFAYSSSDSRYELSDKGGQLLEANGETTVNITDRASVGLWLKGSWLQCRGNGQEVFDNVFIGGAGWEFFTAVPGSDSATSTFSRYLWAVGVSGQLSF